MSRLTTTGKWREQITRLIDATLLSMDPWREFFAKTQYWRYDKKRELQLLLLRALAQEFKLKIQSWNDFFSLRISTKNDLKEFAPHNSDLAIPYQTSGSSGVPFSFYRDKSLEAVDAAIFERAWSLVGRKDELVLRLVSGEPKWPFFDYLRNVTPMNYRTIDDSYAEWVASMRPFLIHGVAGAVRDLSERVIKRGHQRVLKGMVVYLMSEDTRSHRAALSSYFKGIYMGYGTSECRTVASQCRYGTLHVNMETSIAESVDGEIVVTNLLNKVMPFIRYRTGDKGEVVRTKSCRCGIVSDVIEGIEGKAIDYYYAEGMKRPTGWWLVSPISHQYADLVSAWRLEVVPFTRQVRIYIVPRTESIERFREYLYWVEENTGLKAEIIQVKSLPNWRRKLLRVVEK